MEVEGCGPQCLERSHIRSLGFWFYFLSLTRNLLNFNLDVKLFASLLVFFEFEQGSVTEHTESLNKPHVVLNIWTITCTSLGGFHSSGQIFVELFALGLCYHWETQQKQRFEAPRFVGKPMGRHAEWSSLDCSAWRVFEACHESQAISKRMKQKIDYNCRLCVDFFFWCCIFLDILRSWRKESKQPFGWPWQKTCHLTSYTLLGISQ